MGDALGAAVSAAATRTMCGGARVVLSVRMAVPEFDGRVEYSGVVDFDSDRCRLEGDSYVADETAPQSTILDGPTTYTLEPEAGGPSREARRAHAACCIPAGCSTRS